MIHDVMKAVMERFNVYHARYLEKGSSDKHADELAAVLACMNRSERRKKLGERGPTRGMPRTMHVPKGKR